MADTIKTEPTPIQRNDRDVAIELTKIHGEVFGFETSDEIANTYLKFYATAAGSSGKGHVLTDLMPEELKKIYAR